MYFIVQTGEFVLPRSSLHILGYFKPRMLQRGKVFVRMQGEGEIHLEEPGPSLAKSQVRVVVQMLSKMPTLLDVSNQNLFSFIAFLFHTYCLEIGFPPQLWLQCKNAIFFRAIWFWIFHSCVYAMNSGRTKAFAKKNEQVHPHSCH